MLRGERTVHLLPPPPISTTRVLEVPRAMLDQPERKSMYDFGDNEEGRVQRYEEEQALYRKRMTALIESTESGHLLWDRAEPGDRHLFHSGEDLKVYNEGNRIMDKIVVEVKGEVYAEASNTTWDQTNPLIAAIKQSFTSGLDDVLGL